jgi:peptidoglycan hydrolase CwlO-like protein
MRPATHSTDEPPVPIENVQLQAYVNDLRRRIEVQNDLMAALAKDVQKLQTEVEKLSLDLGIRQGEAPGWAEVRP